jgi:hypothetical protein
MNTKRLLTLFAALVLIMAACTVPAAAYLNYNIIWTSSGSQLVKEDTSSQLAPGTTPVHYVDGYRFLIAPSKNVQVITPFTSTINMNGPEPKVRSLFFKLMMPVGMNVTYVSVYNGPEYVYSKDLIWAGTGTAQLYTLDMGSYNIMNRGINTLLIIQNDLPGNAPASTYGAGAKLQW